MQEKQQGKGYKKRKSSKEKDTRKVASNQARRDTRKVARNQARMYTRNVAFRWKRKFARNVARNQARSYAGKVAKNQERRYERNLFWSLTVWDTTRFMQFALLLARSFIQRHLSPIRSVHHPDNYEPHYSWFGFPTLHGTSCQFMCDCLTGGDRLSSI